MTKYEAISSIWSDLNAAYKKKGGKMTRLEFMRSLLGLQSGEVGVRALLASVQQIGSSEDAADLEELCTKIQNAYDNVCSIKNASELPRDLNDLCKKVDYCNEEKYGINQLLSTVPRTIPSIDASIAFGSALPLMIPDLKNKSISAAMAQEYFHTIYTESELVSLFDRSMEVDESSALSKALIKLIKTNKLVLPMVVTDFKTMKKLKSKFALKDIDECTDWQSCIVTDKFSSICVIGV